MSKTKIKKIVYERLKKCITYITCITIFSYYEHTFDTKTYLSYSNSSTKLVIGLR